MESIALPRHPDVPEVSAAMTLASGFLLIQGGIPFGLKCRLHLDVDGIPDKSGPSVPGAYLLLHHGFVFVPQDTPLSLWKRGDPEFYNQLGEVAREQVLEEMLKAIVPGTALARSLDAVREPFRGVQGRQIEGFDKLLAARHTVIVPFVDVVRVDHDSRPGGFVFKKLQSWLHWQVQASDGETRHVVLQFDDKMIAWAEMDWRFECDVEEVAALVIEDFLAQGGSTDELRRAIFDPNATASEVSTPSMFRDTVVKKRPWEEYAGVPRWPLSIPRKDALDKIEACLRQAGFTKTPRALAALWLSRGMHRGDATRSPMWEALDEQKFAAALIARFGDLWPRYMELQTMFRTRQDTEDAARGEYVDPSPEARLLPQP